MEVDEEEMFNGLACPPLEDFAFKLVSDIDAAAINLDADVFFGDQELGDVGDRVPIRLKRQQHGKGKELKRVIQVSKPTQDQLKWIANCLKEDHQQEAEAQAEAEFHNVDDGPVVNKKINVKPIKIAERKGDEDYYSRGKKNVVLDDESSIQLKFESAKRKLHESYQRIEEAKKRKKIQLIEFQNPMPNPKPKPKPEPKMGSMKKNRLGGKKSSKFNRSNCYSSILAT